MSPRTPRRRIHEWQAHHGHRPTLWRLVSPPQLFVGSFLALIAFGTVALRVVPGFHTGARLGWMDSFFTATSAVCVTGLTVIDTTTGFTRLGQGFLLVLIQLGGLGMIAFTTLIILAIGGRLSLRQESLAGFSEFAPLVDVRRLARDILLLTFVIEGAGALALYLLWAPRFGGADAAWHGLFHAVSAFCNAGFSTFPDSLMGLRTSPAALSIIMLLIVLGGIGFLTLEEVGLWWRTRRKPRTFRLTLHSRLVLAVTGILLLFGWAAFTALEWHVTFDGLPAGSRVLNALFLSVTARTAGFNTIDYAQAGESTSFLTILLMSVGGSPGSTAGGVKTTTAGLIFLLAWSRFRGRRTVSYWGRSIPEETIQRAVGLAVVAFGIMTAAVFLYMVTEIDQTPGTPKGLFLRYMFEGVSAFNTVGLSHGVTPTLSPAGKLLTAILMFLGRVGPLTFASAIALRRREPDRRFRYAYEEVVVG